MIFFFVEGRLGNQIFQYAFLRKIAKKGEAIFGFGFNEFKEVFTSKKICNVKRTNKFQVYIAYRILRYVLEWCGKNKLINYIYIEKEKVLEKYDRETEKYTKTIGIFSHFTFVTTCFVQSESFFSPNIINELEIKKEYILRACEQLQCIERTTNVLTFVHVRLGDFKNFKVYGQNTDLPFSYFKHAIKWLQRQNEKNIFIFLTDEYATIEKEFSDIKNKLIIHGNHYGVDFAIMTLCQNAILSASSFSWWGAFLMKDRKLVIAPQYWLGFASRINKGRAPSFAHEIDVLANDDTQINNSHVGDAT